MEIPLVSLHTSLGLLGFSIVDATKPPVARPDLELGADNHDAGAAASEAAVAPTHAPTDATANVSDPSGVDESIHRARHAIGLE